MSTYRKRLTDLYKPEQLATHNEQGTNAGLWLDKYIKNQNDTDSRSGLVKEVAELTVPETYRQFYKRWEEMLPKGARKLMASTNGRMAIGLGDESVLETSIALHHTYGVPYIPGSALKGLASSYAHQRLGEKWKKGSEAYKVIFGDTDEAGYITFFDALLHIDPDEHKKLVLRRDIITVHHPGYYQGTKGATPPSDWDSPTPIPFLSATGTYLIALAAPDLKNGTAWINKTFAILRYALKEMGIGAKTSSGYGRMKLDEIEEDESEEVEAVVPEKASISLLRKIVNASQVTYELFATWEKLPAADDGRVDVANALIQKMDTTSGKKKQPKEEKRYQVLKKFIEQDGDS